MSLRLDKAGQIVRCGVIDCGAAVGERAHGRVLALLPGYARDRNGTLRMTPRSVLRQQRGQYPRPLQSEWATKGQPHGLRPGPMPIKVKCWQCEWEHVVHSNDLHVESADHDAWIAWNWIDD